ncbi:MAG: MASE1 domain-containing protein, partial [Gemmatimonadaceae bacterium]
MAIVGNLRTLQLNRTTVRTGLWLAILTVAYSLTCWFGLDDATLPAHTSVVWPASGIALAACTRWGRRAWLGVWVAALLVNLWIVATPAGISPLALGIAASIALGTTIQAACTAALLQRVAPAGLFVRASAVFRFTGVAAICAVLAPSWTGFTLLFATVANSGTLLDAWPAWWFADLTGVLVFAPLLLQWREILRVSRRKGWIPEAIGTVVATIGISIVVYVGWDSVDNPQNLLAFVALPCVVWIAFRFRPPGVALTAAFVAAIAVGAMNQDAGPLHREVTRNSFL